MAPELRQSLFGVEFQAPVLLASGTCGYGREYAGLIPLDELGGLVTKAVSVTPRSGNPPHRVAETPGGMINAIGLENVGLEAFASEKLPWLRDNLARAHVFVNVVGRSVEEYAAVVSGLDGEEGFLGYEINVSCPNVEGGTMFGTDEAALAELVGRLRRETERPVIVKLTPNVPDIGIYARICEENGADGLSTINTFPGMLIDIHGRSVWKTFVLRADELVNGIKSWPDKVRKPVIGNVTGGISGPAILPMGVYLTWRAAISCSLPVIGIGGIRAGEDALQYILAGAHLVQVGTASFVDPAAAATVQEEIDDLVEAGVGSLSELVGGLRLPEHAQV